MYLDPAIHCSRLKSFVEYFPDFSSTGLPHMNRRFAILTPQTLRTGIQKKQSREAEL